MWIIGLCLCLPYMYHTDTVAVQNRVIQWCKKCEKKAEWEIKFPCGHSVYMCRDCFMELSARVDFNWYFDELQVYLHDCSNHCPICQDRADRISSHCMM